MASMKQKYGGKQGSFALDLAKFSGEVQEAIGLTLREIVVLVGDSLITMSPVDTGRFRGNWQFNLMTPDNSTTEDFDPTGAETRAKIVTGANSFTPGQVAYITNSLPYAIPLEHGHSLKAPLGMVGITQARFQDIVDEAVRNHKV